MTFEDGLEVHRVELTGLCYRMLASGSEAEDAVQETMIRAWSNAHRFDEDRASLRTWLYTIATNVCLDMARSAQRRALAMDLGPASPMGAALGAALDADVFVQPVPDQRVLPASGDPAELAVQRETVRLAFVAALQHLPPRQRVVLILRDVLAWSTAEAAQLLDTTPAAVNSTLQRARATLTATATATRTGTLAATRPGTGPSSRQVRVTHREVDEALLERYVSAFTAYDIETLVALMRDDVVMSMPPYPWWIQGRERVRATLIASAGACANDQLVRLQASGSPAFAQYRDGHGLGLVVLEVHDGHVASTTTYLDPSLISVFGLPMNLQPLRRT